MKFLEPTDAPPPPKLWGKLALVMEKLDELEPGRWLPIEFESQSKAGSFATSAKKKGLKTIRHEAVVYVQKHSHDWKIGAPDRFGKSIGVCKCGAEKTFDDSAPKKA